MAKITDQDAILFIVINCIRLLAVDYFANKFRHLPKPNNEADTKDLLTEVISTGDAVLSINETDSYVIDLDEEDEDQLVATLIED